MTTKRPENRPRPSRTLEAVRDFIPYPTVVETTHRGERKWDIFSRLLKDRIVFLGTEINDDVANIIIAQFLFLESEDPEKEICSTSTAPAAWSRRGLAIYDTMQYVRSDVSTICLGQAASMGAVLLAAGAKGQALRAAERPHHDPPAARRRARPGDRHRDPGARDPAHEGRAHRHPGRRHRASRTIRSPRTSTATSTWAPRRPRSTASSTRCSPREDTAPKAADAIRGSESPGRIDRDDVRWTDRSGLRYRLGPRKTFTRRA